jgi:hypothetical protein
MTKPQFLSLALALFMTTLFATEPALFTPADPETDPPNTLRYELQVITAKPGKLDQLHAWFRDHQADVLAKHGATNLAYLVPLGENHDGKILCLYEYPSLPAIMKFSRAVKADPLWAPLDTSKDGPDRLVEKIDIVQCRPTPYSPLFEPGKTPEPRVFELRTYKCPNPEKLAFLHERFRNFTTRLFAKHGMENVVYFQPLDLEDSDRKLVYLLGHKSHDTAQKSFAGFRADPEWLKARQESEAAAGGSLTNAENGVVSEFFVGTEYSPLK